MNEFEVRPTEKGQSLTTGARFGFRAAILALGFLRVWILRFYVEPDGVNYLDIAREYAKGSAGHAVNGFWSPLFSWLLIGVEWATRGNAYWEVPLLHALNFAVFVASLWCFEFFFGALMAKTRPVFSGDADGAERGDDGAGARNDWAWWTLGYALFGYCGLVMAPVSLDSPDVLVTALVFLATGLVLRLGAARGEGDAADAHAVKMAALLGVVLAVAYLAKTAMFLVGFAFLAAAFVSAGWGARVRRGWRVVAIAGAVFVLISLPWIVVLSRAEHRATFGDSGRIAYWMYTNGVESTFHYHGEFPHSGAAAHAVQAIETHPAVDSFARHPFGSYPLLFDPSFWYEGIHPRFSVAGELLIFRETVPTYLLMATSQAALFAALLALIAFCGWRGYYSRVMGLTAVWLPGAAGIALYFLVHAEARFVGAFVVVCWCALFAAVRMAETLVLRRVVAAVLVVTSLAIAVPVLHVSVEDYFARVVPRRHVQWEVCEALRSMGVAAGERVAVIGDPTVAHYWAHCGEWSIVADVQPEAAREFWAADEPTRERIYRELRGLGVKAVVVAPGLGGAVSEGWRSVRETGYGVLVFKGDE